MPIQNAAEKNVMIADFMEYVHSQNPNMDAWEMSLLDYHSNWNSLISVVEKIERNGVYMGIDRNFCMIGQIEYFGLAKPGILPTVKAETKLDAVYLQVCNYIDWYNSNIKTLTHE